MTSTLIDGIEQKNIENSFTELFTLLKQYDNSSVGTFVYTTEELIEIQHHSDNAIGIILQGLQGLGNLIGFSSVDSESIEKINHLGFFISTITNLTEALYDLRLDADHVVKLRGVMNY